MSVWAPKRYDKLYLVMMWRSKSGSWWTARREASWRVVDEREGSRASLESCENTRKRRRESLRGGSVHMNVSSRATTATWSSKMLEAPRIPCGGEPRTGHPTGSPTKSGPTTRWYVDCVSIWIYACADVTLNLRRVQISPSICVVVDDEYDRNHISPSHVAEFCCSC